MRYPHHIRAMEAAVLGAVETTRKDKKMQRVTYSIVARGTRDCGGEAVPVTIEREIPADVMAWFEGKARQ